jgi:dTDP-alpha-D-glucuronic acid decarboxylase
MSMRVVVTGGCGFLGSHLVERLVVRGDHVTVFDSVPPGPHFGPEWAHVEHVTGDVRDADRLSRVIGRDVDLVCHLAAVVGVDNYLARPADVIDVNFLGTRNVLDAAVRSGVRVLLASTSEVFGKNPAVPWSEDADRVLGATSVDRWAYASSKALAEHLTFAFARQHGLPATVVRYFNVYGPRQRAAYMISRNIHRALNGLPPVVHNDGQQTRSFTYVADAVEGTLVAAHHTPATAFNIGGMDEITMSEVATLIAKLTGVDAPCVTVDTAERLGPSFEDVPRRVPDNAKIRALGWRCETSLQDGLTAMIVWARANPWWLALPEPGDAPR